MPRFLVFLPILKLYPTFLTKIGLSKDPLSKSKYPALIQLSDLKGIKSQQNDKRRPLRERINVMALHEPLQ